MDAVKLTIPLRYAIDRHRDRTVLDLIREACGGDWDADDERLRRGLERLAYHGSKEEDDDE